MSLKAPNFTPKRTVWHTAADGLLVIAWAVILLTIYGQLGEPTVPATLGAMAFGFYAFTRKITKAHIKVAETLHMLSHNGALNKIIFTNLAEQCDLLAQKVKELDNAK